LKLTALGEKMQTCLAGTTTTLLAKPPAGTLRFYTAAFCNLDAALTSTISLFDSISHVCDRNITPAALFFNFASVVILDQNTDALQITVTTASCVTRLQWVDAVDDGTIFTSDTIELNNAYQIVTGLPDPPHGKQLTKYIHHPLIPAIANGGGATNISWLNNNDTASQPELRVRVQRLTGDTWTGIEGTTGLGAKNRQAGIGNSTGYHSLVSGDVMSAKLATNPVVAGSIVLRIYAQMINSLPGSDDPGA
jgi:hypothetical protein